MRELFLFAIGVTIPFFTEVPYIACCLLVARRTLMYMWNNRIYIVSFYTSRNFLRTNGKMGIRAACKKSYRILSVFECEIDVLDPYYILHNNSYT